MEESQIIKLFVVIGVVAILLNVFSDSVIDSIEGKTFKDFTVQLLCYKQNATYFISTPVDNTFCKRIFDFNVDAEEISELCRIYYAGDEELESCVELALLYDKRVEDCNGYISGDIMAGMTSVSSDEADEYCSVLVNMSSSSLDDPTGLSIREIFQDIADRRIKG
ncbi:MAG: hypothetical protein V1718_01310 [archaeon]